MGVLTNPPDDADFNASFRPILQEADHFLVRDLRIVNQQLFLRPLQETAEDLTGVRRTHDERIEPWRVRLSGGVGLKELHGLSHPLGILSDKSETAAVIDVHVRKVERKHVKDAPIDDDKLVVIADQVVVTTGENNSGFEEAHLQLA